MNEEDVRYKYKLKFNSIIDNLMKWNKKLYIMNTSQKSYLSIASFEA